MKQRNNPADFAVPTPKKARKTRKTRAERKAERRALLPIHKRPIVCPPDKLGRHPLFRLFGLLGRGLVIWLVSISLPIFIAAALELGVPNSAIYLTALAVVALVMIFSISKVGRIVAGVGTVGVLGALLTLEPRLLRDIPYSFLAFYNAILTRLHKVGYLAYEKFKVDFSGATATPDGELVIIATCILTVVLSVMFAFCLCRRVRLVPPTIVATSLLMVVLTFNIYSNRIESNLGVTLVIVSFASTLVMAAYDRTYHIKESKQNNRYDTELRLFEDEARPTLPPEYANDKASREARRKAKADLRAKRRAKTVTVEDELDDYFSADRKARKSKKKAQSPAERRAAREAHRATMRRVRAAKHYDRVTAEARSAMGGFAGLAALILCLITIALPATLIKGNFNTIDAIDEKMALAREYVTALLRGDDAQLDRLEYQADRDNFRPHSTDLEQLEFTGKQMFYIRTRYNTNYYLRGWVGTDYENGAWLAVDDELLAEYHALFGKESFPAEELRYDFYHYMKPELVDPDPEEGVVYPEYFLNKFDSHLDYGFVGTLVNLRRVNSPSTLTYFPSVYAPQYGVMNFDTVEESKLTYVNYFDGLYTGRNFHENGLSYATMAYAPVMTNPYWAENQAALIADYNLQEEIILINDAVRHGALTLSIYEEADGTFMFRYTQKQGREETVWRFYHDNYRRNGDRIYIDTYTKAGHMEITMDGSRVTSAALTATVHWGSSSSTSIGIDYTDALSYRYSVNMTDEERGELIEHLYTDRAYADYVYSTYMNTSGSAYIRELAATIRDQAHTEIETTVTETIPDDPETPEDDSYTVSKKVVENVLADVSLAAYRNATMAEVYIQRDRLVRNVIDYIITEMACEYTITPELTNVDPTLDGVENFLRNTKEGYCVQFASATALLLRELGIPARYVEGYVANGLRKTSSQEFIYDGYIRDYQAHAWVEVYFDGVGWIQYETTPQYYTGMYGADTSTGSSTVNPPPPIDLPETEPPATEPPATEPDDPDETDPNESETTDETTGIDDVVAARVTKGSLIALGVMALIAAVAFVIHAIVSRARAAEDHRQSIVAQVLETGFGTNTSDEDRREMALELTDAVTDLFGYYGLSPVPGEFRDDYADRLTSELSAPAEGKRARAADAPALPDLHIALDGMAAEEFGHGMSVPEMKQVAALYLYLRRDLRRRIPLGTRLVLRYVKRKI